MDESRIGQYSISVTTYPIMALLAALKKYLQHIDFFILLLFLKNTI